MSLTVKSFLAAGAAALLSACSGHLSEAERAGPPSNTFAATLHTGYLTLAQAEMDENDFADGRAFAGRALAAAHNEPTAPESLSARKLPPHSLPALADARERLVRALGDGARERAAGEAADAQLAFDCWMQEQEEDFQAADIAGCRDRFFAAMGRIERRGLARNIPESMKPAPLPAALNLPARADESPLATRFVVYFGFDAATIPGSSEREIAKAAAAAHRTGAAMVRITGHADRAGPADHNLRLSRERATAVVQALRRLGLPQIGIATQAYGEEKPLVPTGDGVRESRNRRVEIELTH